jgi:hypothetical protein
MTAAVPCDNAPIQKLRNFQVSTQDYSDFQEITTYPSVQTYPQVTVTVQNSEKILSRKKAFQWLFAK